MRKSWRTATSAHLWQPNRGQRCRQRRRVAAPRRFEPPGAPLPPERGLSATLRPDSHCTFEQLADWGCASRLCNSLSYTRTRAAPAVGWSVRVAYEETTKSRTREEYAPRAHHSQHIDNEPAPSGFPLSKFKTLMPHGIIFLLVRSSDAFFCLRLGRTQKDSFCDGHKELK